MKKITDWDELDSKIFNDIFNKFKGQKFTKQDHTAITETFIDYFDDEGVDFVSLSKTALESLIEAVLDTTADRELMAEFLCRLSNNYSKIWDKHISARYIKQCSRCGEFFQFTKAEWESVSKKSFTCSECLSETSEESEQKSIQDAKKLLINHGYSVTKNRKRK